MVSQGAPRRFNKVARQAASGRREGTKLSEGQPEDDGGSRRQGRFNPAGRRGASAAAASWRCAAVAGSARARRARGSEGALRQKQSLRSTTKAAAGSWSAEATHKQGHGTLQRERLGIEGRLTAQRRWS